MLSWGEKASESRGDGCLTGCDRLRKHTLPRLSLTEKQTQSHQTLSEPSANGEVMTFSLTSSAVLVETPDKDWPIGGHILNLTLLHFGGFGPLGQVSHPLSSQENVHIYLLLSHSFFPHDSGREESAGCLPGYYLHCIWTLCSIFTDEIQIITL